MSEMIQTRASLAKESKNQENFEVITYSDYKPKKVENKKSPQVQKIGNGNSQNELDMKKVRYEVYKFGIKGFTPGKKKKLELDLLLELGAKKPKVLPINYRRLKTKRENEKKELEEQKRNFSLEKTFKKKVSTRSTNRKKQNILEHYGTTQDPSKIKRKSYKKGKK